MCKVYGVWCKGDGYAALPLLAFKLYTLNFKL